MDGIFHSDRILWTFQIELGFEQSFILIVAVIVEQFLFLLGKLKRIKQNTVAFFQTENSNQNPNNTYWMCKSLIWTNNPEEKKKKLILLAKSLGRTFWRIFVASNTRGKKNQSFSYKNSRTKHIYNHLKSLDTPK